MNLITGGTGSFGQTIVEKLLRSDVKSVKVFSRDEAKRDLMRQKISDKRVSFCLGDIRNFESVKNKCKFTKKSELRGKFNK